MRHSRRLAAVAIILLGACKEAITEAPPLAGAVKFAPPARYQMWWSMAEACSGRTADFEAVRWYSVPGPTIGNTDVSGLYDRSTNSIIVVESGRQSGALIRHEMLHALSPEPGHPRSAFVDACGGIVSCGGACLQQAGNPMPPASAPEIRVDDLVVSMTVAPAAPSASAAGGFMAFTVSVTNPHDFDVWVRLTPTAPSGGTSRTFGVILDRGPGISETGNGMSLTGTRFPMLARATRRWVWDLETLSGPFGARGYFNSDTLPRVLIQPGG